MATDKRRIALWAYHHCERENAMWAGTDPMNICPMRGACPGCQEKAIDAFNQVASKRTLPPRQSLVTRLVSRLGTRRAPKS